MPEIIPPSLDVDTSRLGGIRRSGAGLFRSTSRQLAAGFAVVFALGALVPIAVVWWTTAGSLSAGIASLIRAETTTLHQVYRTGGQAELRSAVAGRIVAGREDGSVYLLADARLVPLAGNLERWPAEVGHGTGWSDLTISRGGKTLALRVYHTRLSNGLHLLVGRNIGELIRLRTLILDAVAWSVTVALGLAALMGLLFRRLFLTSLRSIRATADAISRGDISRRLPVAGSGDEFDQLARTLNDMLNRIEELVADVRHVSNAVAHDLRTPLTELRARLEALERRPAADGPGLEDGLAEAIADVDRLIAIFTALLRLAEIDSGMRRQAFAPVDPGRIASDAGELYSALAEAKGIALTVSVQTGLTAQGDRDLLAQAVSNLLDNALKFTPEGGTVDLSVTTGRDEHVIALTVADSGPGIPEADRSHATQRFFRGDRSRHTPGVGLGLALVQAVADLHQATLVLTDNHPGLRASLILPRPDPLSDPQSKG